MHNTPFGVLMPYMVSCILTFTLLRSIASQYLEKDIPLVLVMDKSNTREASSVTQGGLQGRSQGEE